MVKYKQEQTEAVNEQVTNTLINQFSNLMDQIGLVENDVDVKDDLANSDVLQKRS